MIEFLARLLGHAPGDTAAREAHLRELEAETRRATRRADELLGQELRLAYQGMTGDRRSVDVGHRPERRRLWRRR